MDLTSVTDNQPPELVKRGETRSKRLYTRAHCSLLSLLWLRNVRLITPWASCTLTMTEALCCISVDIDAVAGWLGSYGGEDSTSDISRGVYFVDPS